MAGDGRWPKGVSGNPSGRRKGAVNLASILKREIAKRPEGDQRTYAELLVGRVIKDANEGDKDAMNLVWRYAQGLPVATLPDGAQAGILFTVYAPPGVDEPDIIDVKPTPPARNIIDVKAKALPEAAPPGQA